MRVLVEPSGAPYLSASCMIPLTQVGFLFQGISIVGGVRIYNPPLTILSIRLLFSYLRSILLLLGPLGLMGPHVPVTRVWGTPTEANFH